MEWREYDSCGSYETVVSPRANEFWEISLLAENSCPSGESLCSTERFFSRPKHNLRSMSVFCEILRFTQRSY